MYGTAPTLLHVQVFNFSEKIINLIIN